MPLSLRVGISRRSSNSIPAPPPEPGEIPAGMLNFSTSQNSALIAILEN